MANHRLLLLLKYIESELTTPIQPDADPRDHDRTVEETLRPTVTFLDNNSSRIELYVVHAVIGMPTGEDVILKANSDSAPTLLTCKVESAVVDNTASVEVKLSTAGSPLIDGLLDEIYGKLTSLLRIEPKNRLTFEWPTNSEDDLSLELTVGSVKFEMVDNTSDYSKAFGEDDIFDNSCYVVPPNTTPTQILKIVKDNDDESLPLAISLTVSEEPMVIPPPLREEPDFKKQKRV
jgi:hypothetical protein